ncbi:hypothetical protein PKP126_038 [Klebsiella phage PKP126]|uniref:Uncharacterized protein n=1 Tax=Klebsiella phage PKP126 TaxID=1654927 RepID=A0A162E3I5_9CAUD|nr:hypothetical protein BI015_gp38 [Klebsiella phage PKP126]AKJ72974.1 hypothetical protein PKP126_038 [Klebsiella phage PKP126]
MTNEIKSGGKVIATIAQRQVVAFQINIHSTSDAKAVDVPVWANTVAIDADGSIWAYESTVENVRLLSYSPDSWVDKGPGGNKMVQVGEMARFPDWEKSKIDLRGLK